MRFEYLAALVAFSGAIASPANAKVLSIGVYGFATIEQQSFRGCPEEQECVYRGPEVGEQYFVTFMFLPLERPIPRIGAVTGIEVGVPFSETFGELDLINARPVGGGVVAIGPDDVCGSRSSIRFTGGRSFSFASYYCQAPGGTEQVSISGSGSISGYLLNGASVPEPASWALMMVGFGAIGGTIRRGRRRQPFAGTARRTAATHAIT